MRLFKAFLVIGLSLFFVNLGFAEERLVTEAEKKVFEARLRQMRKINNYQGIILLWEEMLQRGLKSKKLYKKLGDLYFFIKQDNKGLDVYRRQAEFLGTYQAWEKYSDFLLWKEKRSSGRDALEKALKLSKNDHRIVEKLAGVYEYHRLVRKSEKLWIFLYDKKGHSFKYGKKVVQFYLRNGLVLDAANTMKGLHDQYGEFKKLKMRILDMRIFIWSAQLIPAYKAMKKFAVSDLPKKDLGYFLTLAKINGDFDLTMNILNRIEVNQKKSLWERRLKLFLKKGIPHESRAYILKMIKRHGELKPLLLELYKTYRIERNIEKEVEVLERFVFLYPRNEKWYRLLYQYYMFKQKYKQGEALYNKVIKRYPKIEYSFYYLSRLYLESNSFVAFDKFVNQKNVPEKAETKILPLIVDYAKLTDQLELGFKKLEELLKKTKNIAPEESEYKGDSEHADKYLEVLIKLVDVAKKLNLEDKKDEYQRKSYEVYRKRFQAYPNQKRATRLIELGEDYGTKKEQAKDFKDVLQKYATDYLEILYYKFLIKNREYDKAEEILSRLLSKQKNLPENKKFITVTFGQIPYKATEDLLEDILDEDPLYLKGVQQYVEVSILLHKYSQAIDYAEKLLTFYKSAKFYFLLGKAHALADDKEESIDAFKNMYIWMKKKPVLSAHDYEIMTKAEMLMKHPLKALKKIREGRKQFSAPYLAMIELDILVQLKRWSAVLVFIEREKLIKKDEVYIRLTLFQAYRKLEKLDKAKKELDIVIQKYPYDPSGLSTKAYFLLEEGEFQRSTKYFRRLADAGGKEISVYQWTAKSLQEVYFPLVKLSYEQEEQVGEALQTRLGLYGRWSFQKGKRIEIFTENWSGEEKTSTMRTGSQSTTILSYHHWVSDFQNWSVQLSSAGGNTGETFSYHRSDGSLSSGISIFNSWVAYESFGLSLGNATKTGLTINEFYNIERKGIGFSLNLTYQQFQFEESDTDKTVSQSIAEFFYLYNLMNDPHKLTFTLIAIVGEVSGADTALFDKNLIGGGKLEYRHPFRNNVFLNVITQGTYDSELKKNSVTGSAGVDWLHKKFQLKGFYQMTQEQQESSTTGETTTTTTNKIALSFEYYL
ncbi:MAG: putative Zn-dependent protease [bacterium]|jgi:predicted Zn-dependent protease